ncbi:UDP-galactose translocator [Seminavis robusta]|uniref:UDP-galactose translocator n=1 Tax=Seminavis robusta TaxID=568900 RepID=A0A9N8DUJ9_9STRA|nr:UDP-galactose translocator [Seminavis robusta]|eukprot:Sro368_g127890.1 UDP-galactose translocator (442) ;mRNA; f:4167-5586
MEDAELPLLLNIENDILTRSANDAEKPTKESSDDRGILDICTTCIPSLPSPRESCCSSKSSLKSALLVLLVIQASSAILVGRYTRSAVPEEELFEISHLVLVIECFKLLLSMFAEYIATKGRLWESVQEHIWRQPQESCKVLVPAILYVIQNSLVYIALSNLSAPVFISLQQGKLVATAVVSVAMLHRKYSVKQWCCLVVLAVGVAIVAIDEKTEAEGSSIDADEMGMESEQMEFFLVGVLAVTGACLTSAFAGVYFEKVLAPEKAASNKTAVMNEKNSMLKSVDTGKPTHDDTRPSAVAAQSLWIRNMQLALFSILFCVLREIWGTVNVVAVINIEDDDRISASDSIDYDQPYFHGFTFWVWVLVLLQAGGGLLVSSVMKYADNVMKGLAMGVGVVVASVMSTLLFQVHLSQQFSFGAFIICSSVYLFSNDPPCMRSKYR